MRSVSAQGGRIAINGSVATVAAGAPTGTSVVALSFAGLRGGSWSISANNYFTVDASGVVRTTSTPTVGGKVYRPKATFTYNGGGTRLEVSVSLAIDADGPPPAPVILLPSYGEGVVAHGAVAGFPYRDTQYASTVTKFTYTGGNFDVLGNMKDTNNGTYVRQDMAMAKVRWGYVQDGSFNEMLDYNWSSIGGPPGVGDHVEVRFMSYPDGNRGFSFLVNGSERFSLSHSFYDYLIPLDVRGNGVLMSATQRQSHVTSGSAAYNPPLEITNFVQDSIERTFRVDARYVKTIGPTAYVSMLRGSNTKSPMTIISSKGAGFATLEGPYPSGFAGAPFALRVEDVDGSAAAELEVQ
jgi:hypothetical protein